MALSRFTFANSASWIKRFLVIRSLMSTDADHRPVGPAESEAPLLSSSVISRTSEEVQERRQDEVAISPQPRVQSATFVSISISDPETPTHHTSILQPGLPSPTHHATYALNDNERSHSMLNPDVELRVIEAWMPAMRKIGSLRATILAARIDIKRERTRCYQQEEYFQDVMDAFMATLNSAHEQGSYLQCKDALDNLSRRIRLSWEEVKTIRQKTSVFEDNLSSQEYQLGKLEEDLYHKIDAEYQQNSTQPTASSPQTSIATEIQAKANDTQTSPNPRDELYSRMGDLRILLDRLNDFEYELRQELDERDLLRATGQIDIPNDTAFFEETRKERAKLQKELEDTQQDIEKLKQQCNWQGIEFEEVEFHSPFYPNADVDETYSTPSTQAEAAALPLPDSEADETYSTLSTQADHREEATLPLPNGSSGILNTFFSTRERVKNWLNDPSSSVPALTGAAEQDPRGEGQARHESLLSGDWVMARSWPPDGRPSSAPSAGDSEAHFGTPRWESGPQVGSQQIEALLEDSMTEPIKDVNKST